MLPEKAQIAFFVNSNPAYLSPWTGVSLDLQYQKKMAVTALLTKKENLRKKH